MAKISIMVAMLVGATTFGITGCANSPDKVYAEMAPGLKKGRLIYAWPIPIGTYGKSASSGASGSVTVTESHSDAASGTKGYNLIGTVQFDYQQTQNPKDPKFDPNYPTRNRIWGHLNVRGAYGQVGPMIYLDCDGKLNGEAYEGAFSNWQKAGIKNGTTNFSLDFCHAVAVPNPLSHPPTITFLLYKDHQIIGLARLSK